MTNTMREVHYEQEGERFEGALLLPAAVDSALPCVLVVPAWEGRSKAQEAVATDLTQLGYAAFCVDVYGGGRRGHTHAECQALMEPLLMNRAALRARLMAAITAVRAIRELDANRLAAIGFCFGGLCVLDLARANAPLAAVASFHGLFTPLPASMAAAPRIDPKIIAFHGWDDPMVSPSDVAALGHELSAARADWQIHILGRAMHAFTNKAANTPESGIQYDEHAAMRAWTGLRGFLRETLGIGSVARERGGLGMDEPWPRSAALTTER